MTRYIEKKFIFKKMRHWLAMSIIVGLLLSVAYSFLFNVKYYNLHQQLPEIEVNDRLLLSNYNGDHLSYPETTRCAIWDIKVKDDVMADLSRNPSFSYKNYLHQYGDVLVERLNSLWVRTELYGLVKYDPIIGSFNLSPYQFNDIFGGAFLHSEQALGINITAPFAYQAKLSLSNEDMVYTRDKVFDLYTSLLSDATLYDDLPIVLIRKESQIEEGVSEMKLIHEVLQTNAPAPVPASYSLQFPKKKLLLCFFLGTMFTQMIVLICSIRDDRVKSIQELQHRTDLVIHDMTNDVNVSPLQNSSDFPEMMKNKASAYLYNGGTNVELTEKMLNSIRDQLDLQELTILSNENIMHHNVTDMSQKIIIPIALMKTTYHQLEEIANQLSPYKLEVQAVVLPAKFFNN